MAPRVRRPGPPGPGRNAISATNEEVLAHCLARVEELAKLEDGWRDEGEGLATGTAAVALAKDVLTALYASGTLPPVFQPLVYPTHDGGLSIKPYIPGTWIYDSLEIKRDGTVEGWVLAELLRTAANHHHNLNQEPTT